MKLAALPLLLSTLLFSCGNAQQLVSETPSNNTTQTSTVGTGTKVATTKPVRDMETLKPISEQDSIKEINPQLIVVLPDTDPEVRAVIQKVDHSKWNELLEAFVSKQGNVNYEGFRNNRTKLTEYISLLGAHVPTASWNKNEKLSYWMNSYNAMTVDLILRNLPLQSIKDIQDPWNQRLWKLGDKWYNLDEIEHKILRKMDEPRIHFGINCASFSCPPLLNAAFTPEKVDAQLEFLTKQFINDAQRNTLTEDRVEISKIFQWFAKDFKQNGSIIDYLNLYSKVKIAPSAKVRYKDYDWALNN